MTREGGARAGDGGAGGGALLERLRAAAHAAVDADDAPAAVALTRLLEERDAPPAPVVCLDTARRRRARARAD